MHNQSVFDQSLLIIIDMQEAFRRPGLPWECAHYEVAATRISQLSKAHSGTTVWTQFIRDPAETGAWKSYYDRWQDYRIEPEHALWDLTLEPAPHDTILQAPTFSKWNAELSQIAKAYSRLTVAGVATDCCVLSTVLSAIDANKYVTVVSDACAGATQEAHQHAINLMSMLTPMVTLTTTDQIIT